MSASIAKGEVGLTGSAGAGTDPVPKGLYVGGRWVAPTQGGRRLISCPADGTPVRQVAEGGAGDAVAAVQAARIAFDQGDWAGLPERQRGDILLRTAELLVRDKAHYAQAEALDTGKRLVEAEYDIDDIAACFRYYGGIAGTDAGRVVDTGLPNAISRIVYAPVGVCA